MPRDKECVLARKFLKNRLQTDITTFHGHKSEWKNVYDLLKRTAECGESNSVLLVGPRGSGKTTLITSVLHSLLPLEEFHKNTLIVCLNGLLDTDDRIALKTATIQLNLENAANGKVFGSFAENLAFLLACLKSGDKNKSKSVIFVLEEFDMFCAHHNQTLLYNLFDISQSAQAPICVVGITCRLDVTELLEKRVKSRFSHRQIFLFPSSNNFGERINLFKKLLRLPTEKDQKSTDSIKPYLKYIGQTQILNLRNPFDSIKYKFTKEFVTLWNKSIDGLAADSRVQKSLENMYEFSATEASLKTLLFKLVSKLSFEHPEITVEDIMKVQIALDNDDKISLICGLSSLEICLIIAMKHHSEIYDRDPFNFEIIFNRVFKFMKTSATMQGINRAVILKGFEHLKMLEFIVPINTLKSQKEFQMHKLLLTYGQINQAISKYHALPTDIAQWAQSSII